MLDAISNAEISDQYVELLPDRTVLSLLPTDIFGGPNGDAGTRGADGQGMSRFTMLGMIGWGGGSDPVSNSGGAAGSSANG